MLKPSEDFIPLPPVKIIVREKNRKLESEREGKRERERDSKRGERERGREIVREREK